jgi:two-component system copper resistance phosphate regulon response regulator CusR
MPRLDGLALLATLRQSRQATLPILMTSAYMTIEPQARVLGVTAFLVKPFSIPQLTAILKALLPHSGHFLLYGVGSISKTNVFETHQED